MPIRNTFRESFNGRLSDECLNAQSLENLHKARTVIAELQVDYNER